MVLGFNHNIRYKGELFHVQTEDSGRANPHIITLLYRGGTILASAKTSYADIIKVDQLEVVVESIMKEQHKEMMRRLKGGEFDARIFPGQAAAPVATPAAPTTPAVPTAPAAQAAPAAQVTPSTQAAQAVRSEPAAQAAAAPQPAAAIAAVQPATAPSPAPASPAVTASRPASAPPKPTEPPAPPAKRSLDEVILDYLITGEEK